MSSLTCGSEVAAELVGDADGHHARLEQQDALDEQGGLVVQRPLLPMLEDEVGQEDRGRDNRRVSDRLRINRGALSLR